MQASTSFSITGLIPQPLRDEAYFFKYYLKRRYKEITSIAKTYPFRMGAAFLVHAAVIYYLGVIERAVFTSLYSLHNYLNHTYCRYSLCKSQTNLSGKFWALNHPMFLTRSEEWIQEIQDEIPELVELQRATNERERLEAEAYRNDPRPIALFLRAKEDWNGAFDSDNIDDGIRIKCNLSERYKIVLIDNISKVDQIADGLKAIADKRVQQVWFLAHGTPTSMLMDGKNEITGAEVDSLKELMQEKLADNANVILFSCSTGATLSKGDNIATKLSKALPGRTIWAPTAPASPCTIEVKEDHSCYVEIFHVVSRLEYLAKKIGNCFRLQPFKKIESLIDLTAQFKDGKRVVD